ncbi:MAG: ATP-binding protein, partial [Halobacteria archaeon]|nr:ATP-binding protein [Halobacteria archaeon]
GLISSIGAFLSVIHISNILGSDSLVATFVGGVLPLLMSITLVLGGYWLVRSDLANAYVSRVAIWCIAGIVAMIAVMSWNVFYQRTQGALVSQSFPVFTNNVSAAALAGLLIGFYDARARMREDELREERHKLQIVNRVLRHDIRNDVNIILGMGESLRERVDADGEGRELVEDLLMSARHVIDVTETVRQLIKIFTRTDEKPLEGVRLVPVLDASTEKLGAVQNAEVEVELDDVPGELEVWADNNLRYVFDGLFNNAVVYNESDEPLIEVSVDESDETVVVNVVDNGSSVPDDSKDEIFGRSEEGLESPGTRIDLYLVDRLVRRYGGQVWIEDMDVGDTDTDTDTDAETGCVYKVMLNKPDS